jgi:prephenate dehydratase
MMIAIQGAEGSFHHIAAQHFYGDGHDYLYGESFAEVFAALKNRDADTAVVAIENSLFGSINEVYDLLVEHELPVVGEVVEHIHQNLIGFDGTNLPDIKRVYSHPVALAQCAEWLEKHLPHADVIEHHDTAAAVEYVKVRGKPTAVAIASHLAADIYGMSLLHESIQDEHDNFTRFLVLQRKVRKADVEDADKASLVLTTSHKPGALYDALGVFKELNCNLTKLQSRPIRGEVWTYQFYIDVEAGPDLIDEACAALKKQECTVQVLGTYKAAKEMFDD